MSKRFKNRIKRISANNIELSFMTYRDFFLFEQHADGTSKFIQVKNT